jgi:RES domain-containing protein
MLVWRICKAKYSATALSGKGARLYSGRWNPAGVSMVYTSTSLALAALEFFVHLDPALAPDDLVAISADIPAHLATGRVLIDDLPIDWQATDHPMLHRLGEEWIAESKSVALQVPSVAVEGDWNVLLNLTHPDFAKIMVNSPKAWSFDHRMFKARS